MAKLPASRLSMLYFFQTKRHRASIEIINESFEHIEILRPTDKKKCLSTGSFGLFHGTTKLHAVRVPKSWIWQVGVFGKDLVGTGTEGTQGAQGTQGTAPSGQWR